MKLRCRIFGHEGADWWVPIFRHRPRIAVEVRRCYRCGDIVEAREKRTDKPGLPAPPTPAGGGGLTVFPRSPQATATNARRREGDVS